MTLAEQTAVDLTLTAPDFSSVLALYTGSGGLIFQDAGSGVRHGKVFLAPGDYKISVGRTSNTGGNYTLTSPRTAMDGCGQPINGFTVPGATVTGTVTESDCSGNGGSRGDAYALRLTAGQTLTVSVTMDQVGLVQVTRDGTPEPQVSRSVAKGATVPVAFQATTSGLYRVFLIYPGTGQNSALPINYTVSFR